MPHAIRQSDDNRAQGCWYQSKAPGFELFLSGATLQRHALRQRLQAVHTCNRRALDDRRQKPVKEICREFVGKRRISRACNAGCGWSYRGNKLVVSCAPFVGRALCAVRRASVGGCVLQDMAPIFMHGCLSSMFVGMIKITTLIPTVFFFRRLPVSQIL